MGLTEAFLKVSRGSELKWISEDFNLGSRGFRQVYEVLGDVTRSQEIQD